MASRTEDTRRTVIPNWNDFKTTSLSGELMGNKQYFADIQLFPINNYVGAWKEQQNIAVAGDLLSAAIMNHQTENKDVLEAAQFIIERSDECTISMMKTAQLIASQTENKPNDDKSLSLSSKLDQILDREIIIRQRVKFLRNQISRFPYNAIWYVELARAYTSIGLLDKASQAMAIALHLSPESRFVSRSASRLYIHIGDIDRAHYVITHNPLFKRDPWLLASEIAINSSRGRNSLYIKDGLNIINSDNYSPFSITELSSAIGTKELASSRKKAKVLLAKSLIQPNDNSLSQADWLMNNDQSLGLDFSFMRKPILNFESDARFAFLKDEFSKALSYAIDWVESAPFSKSAIGFAADMAYTYQQKYQDAIKILKIGLKGNPKDTTFLNNLAYAYALDNQTTEADKVIQKLMPLLKDGQDSKICAIATMGLIEYRKGNVKIGNELYLKAIEEAKQQGKLSLAQKAMLNNIREEVRLNPFMDKSDVSEIINHLSTGNIKETVAMRNEIISLLAT